MMKDRHDRDYLETLKLRIDKLEQEINTLKNAQKPTIPIYDNASFPGDAIEGQIAIAPASA